MNVGEILKNLLFPKVCLGCGRIGSYFCENCLKQIPTLLRHETICPVCAKPAVGGATHPRCQTKYTPDGLITLFHYEGMVRKAIKLLKYQRVKDLIPEFSTVITQILQYSRRDISTSMIYIIEVDNPTIVPVPLHSLREKSRWFNQSELLAKSIAEEFHLNFQHDILVRTKFSKPQAGLLKKDRLQNIKDSFKLTPNAQLLTPSSVILFDDVWTTGATMRECVNVLKRGGVKKVWCLTVAR